LTAALRLTFLDRLIGYLSPEAGMRRARARFGMERLRSYDGAKVGRRTGGWITGGASANAEISSSLEKLRQRSRDLLRNNPWAVKAINSRVSNIVGTGIITKLLVDGETSDAEQAVFDRWVTYCDADGQHDYYGLQALVARTVEESGECLVRYRWRRPEDGLEVPLQLQVMEPDHLDTLKTEALDSGGQIVNGVEFNAIGQRVAYWLFPTHPGELAMLGRSFVSKRVPADEVLHIYEKTRPGQVRGVPRLTPTLMTFRDLDDYEEAELLRKGIEACFAVFVSGSESGVPSLGPEAAGKGGSRIEEIGAGMIHYTQPGESVSFAQPSNATGHNEFIRGYHHKLAAGANVTCEQLTGDLSRVNYSSIRAGLLEFRRSVEQYQWLTFIPQLCNPVVAAFSRAARLSGAIKTRKPITGQYTPPRWEWVDPVKDLTGELMEVAAGFKSWQEAVRRRGTDPKNNIKQIQEDQHDFGEAGIVLQILQLALGAAGAANNSGDRNANA
jgi:lambda family phage portal protein